MRFQIERSFPLTDIEVSRAGDGRTVTAYVVPFDSPSMVYDDQFTPARHLETVSRSAFNKTVKDGTAAKAQVFFNHGKTLDGTPSERFSMPIGVPLDVRPDGKGLLTVTRYAKTDLGDEVLELIRDGAIRGHSFRGPVYNHTSKGGMVTLTECGLREYSPTPFPAYAEGTEIVSIRSASDLLDAAAELTAEERAALLALLNPDTPVEEADPDAASGTSDVTSPEEPSTVTDHPAGDIDLLKLENERRHLS